MNEDAAWYYATPMSAAENIKVSSGRSIHAPASSPSAVDLVIDQFCVETPPSKDAMHAARRASMRFGAVCRCRKMLVTYAVEAQAVSVHE